MFSRWRGQRLHDRHQHLESIRKRGGLFIAEGLGFEQQRQAVAHRDFAKLCAVSATSNKVTMLPVPNHFSL